jgi:hypothetical protein
MTKSRYRDVKSRKKKDNTEAFLHRMSRAFPGDMLGNATILLLDGEHLRTSSILTVGGINSRNITVVERDDMTYRKQLRRGLGVRIVHGTSTQFLRECTNAEVPCGFYLDGMGSWLGSDTYRPLDDVNIYLEKAWAGGKDEVVLAMTFSQRNNYQCQWGLREDFIDVLSTRGFNGKRLLRKDHVREVDIVDVYLRDYIFPFSGWKVRQGMVTPPYRRDRRSQQMIFFLYTLRRCEKNEDVRWPVVDGTFLGFAKPKDGEWEGYDFQEITKTRPP